MKTKMTIHRALAELKVIDSKIQKAITEIDPIGLKQKEKLVNGLFEQKEFESKAKAKLQSVNDLIKRKTDIKSAIVESNAETVVKINENEMTVADAITFKSIIDLKKELLSNLKAKNRSVVAKYTTENEKINNVALENAKIMIGKQGDDRVKATDEDVRAIVDPFVKRNEFHLVDPLKLDDYIETLSEEIDNFEIEVDAVLSEANAITIIEI